MTGFEIELKNVKQVELQRPTSSSTRRGPFVLSRSTTITASPALSRVQSRSNAVAVVDDPPTAPGGEHSQADQPINLSAEDRKQCPLKVTVLFDLASTRTEDAMNNDGHDGQTIPEAGSEAKYEWSGLKLEYAFTSSLYEQEAADFAERLKQLA